MSARARRLFSTRTYGTPQAGGSSQTAQTEPFSAAEAIYRCPSLSKPRTATKSVPGAARRES